MNNKRVIPFAGYPICVYKSGFILSEKELRFLKDQEYLNHSRVNGLRISKNTDILQLKKLNKLKNYIKKTLDDYVSNVMEVGNKFSFCQSWSTIQVENSYHPNHPHPNHIISSVYYAKATNTGLTFNLARSRIQEGFFFKYDIKSYNIYNSASWTTRLDSGDIVFFPGHIHHESQPNNEEERIVVGSSFFMDGKLGKEQQDGHPDVHSIDITNNKKIKY